MPASRVGGPRAPRPTCHTRRMTASDVPPVVAVVGATASGKTDLSLDLAERLGGEIVNTDAMQVYRGMDVGTAKLPAAERRGVPHHLLDVLDIDETGLGGAVPAAGARGHRRPAWPRRRPGAGRRLRALHPRGARPVRVPRHRRGRTPIAGGRARRRGPAALHARLAAADPEAAAGILPGNGRRIVRALEVLDDHRAALQRVPAAAEYLLRERPPGRGRDRPADAGGADRATGWRGCSRPASWQRSRRCWAGAGGDPHRVAARSATARSPAHLAGELTLAEARERTAAATRRFARRQDSWFRKDPRITWVDCDDPRAGRAGPRGTAPLSERLKSRVGARETSRTPTRRGFGYCTTPRAFTMPAP